MIKSDPNCPGGEIGRHKGLKIPRRKLRAGSSPALGTIQCVLASKMRIDSPKEHNTF